MSKRNLPDPEPIYHNLADWRPKRRKGGTRSQPLALPSKVIIEDHSRRKRSAGLIGRSYGPSGPRGRPIRGAVSRTHGRIRNPAQVQPAPSSSGADFDVFDTVVFEQNLPPTRKRKVQQQVLFPRFIPHRVFR